MEKEYIERNEALHAAKEAWAQGEPAARWIEGIESADVVPVVRCKNCTKCLHDEEYNRWWCDNAEVTPNFFCANGQRRE